MKDVGLIWLTGLQYPDKNTLWRFWRDNKAALKNVYRQVLKLAARANLIGMVLHAVDGTKLQSAAAKDKAVHRDALEQRLNELIDQNVEEAIRETERAEAEDEGEYRLPEALQDRRRLREEIQRHLEDMKREGRKHKIDRDAEARLMKIEGKAEYGYNAQVVVDEQSGLIVGEQVVTDVSDNSQLVPMLDEVRQNLGAVAEQTVADGGYWTGAQLVQAEDRGYPVLVASNQAEKAHEPYHLSRFEYHAEKDEWACPRGERLTFQYDRKPSQKPYRVRLYRCQAFEQCPVRWQCSRNPKGRTIEMHPLWMAMARQLDKQKHADHRRALRRRGQIVERIFGWVKEGMHFRRWSVTGQDLVRTQWALLCTVLNLRTLYKYWITGRLSFQTA